MDAATQSVRRVRWWLVPLATLVGLAAVSIGVRALGLAGYRGGWLWTGLLVVVGPIVATLVFGRAETGRGLWTMTFAVIGIVATAWLVDHAPLSKAALAGRLDRVTPPFVKTTSESRTGHSWCRPSCPRVVRVLKAPDRAPFAELLDVAAQFRLAGLIDNLEPVGRRHPVNYIRAYSYRVIAEARVTRKTGYLELTLTMTSRRGRVHHQGPLQTDRTVNLSTR